jgi:lysophospholipase L1-like esterase
MGATGRRRRGTSKIVGLAVLAATALAAIPTPASAVAARSRAAAPKGLSYVAIGDSYASGAGTGVIDVAGAPCLRSSKSYAGLWAAQHSPRAFTFLACAGATTVQTHDGQLPDIPPDADLVTVSVGGNDVGFGPVLRTCAAAGQDLLCLAAVHVGETAARTTMPAGLAAVLGGIRRRAPHARIVVLGYPRLFEPGACTVSGVPNQRRRAAINRAADLLDFTIAATTRTARATFVDVRGRFAGHGVCAPAGQTWLGDPSRGSTAAYHPNAAGYRLGYLPALEQALTGPAAG